MVPGLYIVLGGRLEPPAGYNWGRDRVAGRSQPAACKLSGPSLIGVAEDYQGMAKNESLLVELEAGLRDDKAVRWELKGYGNVDTCLTTAHLPNRVARLRAVVHDRDPPAGFDQVAGRSFDLPDHQ